MKLPHDRVADLYVLASSRANEAQELIALCRGELHVRHGSLAYLCARTDFIEGREVAQEATVLEDGLEDLRARRARV